ncbi:MAG: hypothetical protein H7Y11_13870 [Armatimonadetes bacterium]|nr:hypothetical protein [Anaerolineae bacterium]
MIGKLFGRVGAWFNFSRVLYVSAGGFAAVVVLLFGYAGLSARSDPNGTAVFFQILRDVFLLIMALHVVLIFTGIVVLILQVAGTLALLRAEVKPLIDNLQSTLNTAKGSAQFVGENLATPLIKAGGFAAGAGVFLRNWGGIRKAIRRTSANGTGVNHD